MRELHNGEMAVVSGAGIFGEGIIAKDPVYKAALEGFDSICAAIVKEHPALKDATHELQRVVHGYGQIADVIVTNTVNSIKRILGIQV